MVPGGIRQVAVLTQDSGPKEKILWIVIKKQNADGVFDQVQNLPSRWPGHGMTGSKTEIGCKLWQIGCQPSKAITVRAYGFLCICLTSSGRRLKAATLRIQRRCSKAGEPLIMLPGATSPGTPDCAVTTTPSPIKL